MSDKVMTVDEAVEIFGTKTKVARRLGLHPSTVSNWGEFVPDEWVEKIRMSLELESLLPGVKRPDIEKALEKAKKLEFLVEIVHAQMQVIGRIGEQIEELARMQAKGVSQLRDLVSIGK